MGMAGPRFFGFVIGGSLPVTLAANWLAGAWDQNSAYYNATPGTALAWSWWRCAGCSSSLGCRPNAGGHLSPGRRWPTSPHWPRRATGCCKRAGWNVEAEGLFGAPPITVIVGAEVHPSVIKSLGLLGLGRNRLIKVPVDGQGRMRAEALPVISGPTIVIAQAGNVNTGAFDPFSEICERAHQAGAWVHVDGAFGLWAATAPSIAEAHRTAWPMRIHGRRTCTNGSTSPMTAAWPWCATRMHCAAAMAITAEYLPTASPFRNPSDFTPELSRRARGVEVWAALRSLGRKGVC